MGAQGAVIGGLGGTWDGLGPEGAEFEFALHFTTSVRYPLAVSDFSGASIVVSLSVLTVAVDSPTVCVWVSCLIMWMRTLGGYVSRVMVEGLFEVCGRIVLTVTSTPARMPVKYRIISYIRDRIFSFLVEGWLTKKVAHMTNSCVIGRRLDTVG